YGIKSKDSENVNDENVNDENVNDENVNDENVNDENVNDENVNDENVNDENVNDENVNDENVNDENVNDENVDRDGLISQIIDEQQSANLRETRNKYDQLTKSLKVNLAEFNLVEGKQDCPQDDNDCHNGINFMPTCKMVKMEKNAIDGDNNNDRGTNESNYNTSVKKGKRYIPSNCDRILYTKNSNDKPLTINCTKYNRFDKGNIKVSDHTMVYGVFELNPENDENQEGGKKYESYNREQLYDMYYQLKTKYIQNK
ncbi:hypothetical protein HOK00_03155, partial [bacterium]|nr:hypothetical protein [bacterium]